MENRRPDPALVERDMKTLEALVRAGADLDRPLTVDHFLYVATEREARDAAAELSKHGFAILIDEREGGQWVVIATREELLSPSTIADLRTLLTSCAERHGGDYDGWGAEVRDRR